MTMIRKLSRPGTICLIVFTGVCSAQSQKPALLRSADLQSDAAILREAYESLHPGLYRYNDRSQMDAAFAELNQQLDHDETLQEAFLAFSVFAAKVRCGHTQANPVNQTAELKQALFKSPARVPFYFEWLNRRMIVLDDFSQQHAFPAGSEIVSINGVSAQSILTKLMTIARADGANDSKRIAQLAVTGDSEYETFDIYYPLFFPLQARQFDFVIRRPGERRREHVSAEALTFEQRIAPIKRREDARKGGSEALFESKPVAGGSVYIRMPTWALYDSKWDWKSWLNEKIDNAAEDHAPALIIDLRGNEGGDDVGNEILSHLTDKPISLSPIRRLVRYRRIPDNLVPYLDTWDKTFRDWGAAAVDLPEPWPTAPQEVSYFKLTRYDDDASGDVIQPSGKRFLGKVFVLIDATNSSATFQFAQNVQRHHLGLLVGQATGGSQRGINGGAFFFLRLPHSGIELDLPLIGTFPPEPMPDAGVAPDIPVTRTASDIAGDHDPEMEAVLRQIRKPQSR